MHLPTRARRTPLSKPRPGSRYGPETVAAAEMLYVIERRTRADVMEKLGISSSTFNRWRNKGRWDERRGEAIVSIPSIVQDMKADIQRTYDLAKKENRPLTSGERDGVFKTITKMQQLDKGALFSQHGVQVMDLWSAYLKQHAPALHGPLVEHIVAFTRRLAETPLV